MTALIAFSLILVDPSPKVTIDLPIVTLPRLLQEVSKQTGIPHKIGGEGKDLFVFVKAKQMPDMDLRQNLAEVFRGKWSFIGGEYYFTCPSEEQRIRQAKAEFYAEELNKLDLSPLEPKTVQHAINELELSRRREPGLKRQPLDPAKQPRPENRLLARMLKSIGAQAIADVPAGQSRTYSSKTLAGLTGSVPNSGRFLSIYNQEFKEYQQIVSRIPNPVVEPGRTNALYHPYQVPRRSEDEATDFALVIENDPWYGLTVFVRLFSSLGNTIDRRAHFWFVPPAFSFEKNQVLSSKLATRIKLSPETDFLLTRSFHDLLIDPIDSFSSEEEQGLLKFYQGLASGASTDWHGGLPTRLLNHLAQEVDLQIVASVPTSVPGFYFSGDELSVRALLTEVFCYTGVGGSLVKMQGDVLLLNAVDASETSEDLVRNRELYHRFLPSVANGSFSPTQHGEFTISQRRLDGDNLFISAIEFMQNRTLIVGDPAGAVIYSQLNPQQVQSAKRGGVTMSISNLSNIIQASVIADAAFDRQEPILGSQNGALTLKTSEDAGWVLLDDRGKPSRGPDARSIAYRFIYSEETLEEELSKAYFAYANTFTISCSVAGLTQSAFQPFEEYAFSTVTDRKVRFHQLPLEFQKEIRTMIKQIEEEDEPNLKDGS